MRDKRNGVGVYMFASGASGATYEGDFKCVPVPFPLVPSNQACPPTENTTSAHVYLILQLCTYEECVVRVCAVMRE